MTQNISKIDREKENYFEKKALPFNSKKEINIAQVFPIKTSTQPNSYLNKPNERLPNTITTNNDQTLNNFKNIDIKKADYYELNSPVQNDLDIQQIKNLYEAVNNQKKQWNAIIKKKNEM